MRDRLWALGGGRARIAVPPPAIDEAEPGLNLFLARVRRAPERILILDFDVAVAPVVLGEGMPQAIPEIAQILRAAMATGVRVAVVGELPVASLEKAVAGLRPRPELWGRDGLERLTPDGRYSELSPLWLDGRWRDGVRRGRLERRLVVRRLLQESRGNAAVALLGGVANEHAFAELLGRGLSVLIASRRRACCADVWIRSRPELFAFLRRWMRAVRSGERSALRQAG